MLTALLAVSGNGSDLTGVSFLPQLCWGRELLSFRMAHGQAESMTEQARLMGKELARSVLASSREVHLRCGEVLEAKCGDTAKLLIDIFKSRTVFLHYLKPEFLAGFIKYMWCFSM